VTTLLEIGLSNAVMASALAVLAAAMTQLCRRPAVAHCLWLLVLLKLVTPPLLPVHVSWPDPPPAAENQGTGAAPAADPAGLPAPDGEAAVDQALPEAAPLAAPAPEALPVTKGRSSGESKPAPAKTAVPWVWVSWPALARPLWLAGSLLWFAWVVLHVRRFQRLLRHARPAPATLQELARGLAGRLGLARCPKVWLVPGAVSPMVWAVGRAPRLLFPARLLERLDREQQRALLAHELAHLRRRDHWVRFLELLVLGLYWWHPVVWWARRELHEAEEQCCDAWVVWALDGAGRAYALALLQTVAFFSHARSALPVAASGVGQVPQLRRRLTMIMQGQTPRSLSWAGGCVVLGLGLLLVPSLQLRAQPTPKLVPPPGGDKTSRQEQIDTLRKAIKVLEDLERADKKKGDGDKEKAAATDKAEAEVKALARLVEAKRQELQRTEMLLMEAVARLSKLKGTPMPGYPMMNPFGKGGMGMGGPSSGFPGMPTPGGKMGGFGIVRPGQPGPAKVAPKGKPPADLEQKLDRLLKELDELRRELRGGKGPAGVAPMKAKPAGPGQPVPPGAGQVVIPPALGPAPAAKPLIPAGAAPLAGPKPQVVNPGSAVPGSSPQAK
jgi:beta-lactamase regulating signal transducer with metallopeptidase domain